MQFLVDCAFELLRPPFSLGNQATTGSLGTSLLNATKFVVPNISKILIENVESILITNCYNMLALPFITEYTRFKGKIYATEPTVEFGRFVIILVFLIEFVIQMVDDTWPTGALVADC